jgi:hypothetical protein
MTPPTLSLLGIGDPWVLAAYLLTFASAILCVIYGLICWNRGDQTIEAEDLHWAQEEIKVEEEL